MMRATCKHCGAARCAIDTTCPYCGRRFADVAECPGALYEEILAERGVVFETRAVKRLPMWAHLDCRLRVTRDHLIFDDFDDAAYSFKISMDELARAEMSKPRGWLSSGDDLLISLDDGREFEIGLEPGLKQQVLEIIQAILRRNP